LLSLEAEDEHLLGPVGSFKVVLEHSVEEFHEFLVAALPRAWQGVHILEYQNLENVAED
jgi:hypothetical protein